MAAFGKTGSTTAQDFIEVPNVAPAGDRLILVWVVHRASTEAQVQQISSVDGLGLHWTKHFHSAEHNLTRFALFSAITAATPPEPGNLRIEFDSGSERTNVIVLEIAGTDLSTGAESALTNMVVHEGFNNTSSRTHYLESFIDPEHNATLAFHLVGNGQSISVEEGLTRVAHVSNSSTLTSAAAFRAVEEVTPTFSWPEPASNGGLALELRAAGTPPERQITRRDLAQGFSSPVSSLTTEAVDPAPHLLYIAFVASSRSRGGPNAPTVSGPGDTAWSAVGTTTFASTATPTKRLTALVAKPQPGGPAPVTISFPRVQDGAAWILYELSGAEIDDGAVAAIRQVRHAAADASSSLEARMSAFGSPANATLAAMAFAVSGPAADDDFAPEPGYALAMDTSTRVPVGGGDLRAWSEWRASPETSPSGTVELPAHAAMLGIEVRASGAPQAPAVTDVAPDVVPSSGGTAVAIRGTDLLGTTSVRFGAVEATRFTVVSSTRIDAIAPSQAPTRTEVVVSGAAGTSADTPDDDVTVVPSVSLGDATVEEASGPGAIIATLSEPAPFAVSVSHATAAGTALAPDDYLDTTGTTTFAPGDVAETISVPVVDDTLDEANESFAVTLSSPVDAAIGEGSATAEIVDDDAPPSIAIQDAALVESGGAVAVTISLSAESGRRVEVRATTSDGTAVAASDYSAVDTVVTIPAGSRTTEVSVPLLDDEVSEPQEAFSLMLSSPTNTTLGDSAATVTIVDDEGTPALRIDDVLVVEGDPSASNAVFTISMSPQAASDVTVSFATADGSATAGSDYVTTSGVATIPAGRTTTEITVPLQDDGLDEPSEHFFVNLSDATGASIADAQAQATIGDDDAPQLSIDDVSVNEGDSGSVEAWFTVELSSSSPSGTTVDFRTMDGTATAGRDYSAKSGSLSFLPGERSRRFRVLVSGDAVDEADETLFVDLSNASGATVADGRGVGTILDDDEPPPPVTPDVSIGDVAIAEGAAGTKGTASFTVSLSAAATNDVTVSYATADGTATAPDDYATTSGTLTIPANATSRSVRVVVKGDALDEPHETFIVDLSNPSGATIADGRGEGTIVDDDESPPPPTPTLAIGDVSATEGSAGVKATLRFPVSLSTPQTQDVTFSYASVDDTATASLGDYNAVSGVGTIAAGTTSTTIRVVVRGDAIDEADETFFVDLSNGSGATIADGRGIGTIVDDD